MALGGVPSTTKGAGYVVVRSAEGIRRSGRRPLIDDVRGARPVCCDEYAHERNDELSFRLLADDRQYDLHSARIV